MLLDVLKVLMGPYIEENQLGLGLLMPFSQEDN